MAADIIKMISYPFMQRAIIAGILYLYVQRSFGTSPAAIFNNDRRRFVTHGFAALAGPMQPICATCCCNLCLCVCRFYSV